ncbi:DUF4158 domain-containing protein [Rhizobium oryzihabitans]|uniref:DUF4158 domain-containing protein n=1 Tax=Rhizobium oryzihabitans TaxID=2267833 RepID=UPI003CCDBE26
MRPFSPSNVRAPACWLTPVALTLRQKDKLADRVAEELRRRRILTPTRSALESILYVAIQRGIRITHRALAGGLGCSYCCLYRYPKLKSSWTGSSFNRGSSYSMSFEGRAIP